MRQVLLVKNAQLRQFSDLCTRNRAIMIDGTSVVFRMMGVVVLTGNYVPE